MVCRKNKKTNNKGFNINSVLCLQMTTFLQVRQYGESFKGS